VKRISDRIPQESAAASPPFTFSVSRFTDPVFRFTPLPRSFYEPSAALVAPQMLGHWLVHNTPEGPVGGVIVETEAYLADDPACHAFRGETARNRSMFGPPGHAYLYFIYGNHWCFNAVCGARGVGEAVLVRAIEPVSGLGWMRARRRVAFDHQLTNGPGKLCAALGLDRSFDGVDLCDANSLVFIAENPDRRKLLAGQGAVTTSPRIGITKAAPLPLRFHLQGNIHVSRRAVSAGQKPRGAFRESSAVQPSSTRPRASPSPRGWP
jgi:DNA-3-methyladenine glycosylase